MSTCQYFSQGGGWIKKPTANKRPTAPTGGRPGKGPAKTHPTADKTPNTPGGSPPADNNETEKPPKSSGKKPVACYFAATTPEGYSVVSLIAI